MDPLRMNSVSEKGRKLRVWSRWWKKTPMKDTRVGSPGETTLMVAVAGGREGSVSDGGSEIDERREKEERVGGGGEGLAGEAVGGPVDAQGVEGADLGVVGVEKDDGRRAEA